MITKEHKNNSDIDLDFDGLGDMSKLLDGVPDNSTEGTGGPLILPLDQIDEDPDQPRKTFDMETLKELSGNIELRGVKTPVSVRIHPEDPERYILNHGARRYRASKMAGKDVIPAFIDNDYSLADQVVENLQRDNLTPREIAEYIDREIRSGKKKKDIAKLIGRSPAFITQHAILLDLPSPIAEVFYSERCNDVTVINEVVKLAKSHEAEVYDWIADADQELTRSELKRLKDFLQKADDKAENHHQESSKPDDVFGEIPKSPTSKPSSFDNDLSNGYDQDAEQPDPEDVSGQEEEPSIIVNEPYKVIKKPMLHVVYQGRFGTLVLNRMVSDGFALVRFDNGEEVEADLGEVQPTALSDS